MKDLGYPDKYSTNNLGTLWFMMLFIGLRMVFLLLYKIFRYVMDNENQQENKFMQKE